MGYLNRQAIREALEELSDVELQRRLWLSDGSNGSWVSSFEEAVESLFTDSGLVDALRPGETEFSAQAVAAFGGLEKALAKVNTLNSPGGIIEDHPMARVRSIALQLLDLLEIN